MSWIITIAVGLLVGWIFGAIMRSSWRTGLWANIWIGILGSIFGVWFFAFVLGIGTTDTSFASFQGISLLWQVIGAIVALFVVNATAYAETPESTRRQMEEYSRGTAQDYRRRR